MCVFIATEETVLFEQQQKKKSIACELCDDTEHGLKLSVVSSTLSLLSEGKVSVTCHH